MIRTLIEGAQLITLIIGIFIVAMKVGARDQMLSQHGKSIDSLESITRDLLKAQATFLASDAASAQERAAIQETLRDIRERLRIQENRRYN